MARPRKLTREMASLADCDQALADLLTTMSEIKVLSAERDLAVAEASAKWEPLLDEAKKAKADLLTALERYYYAHQAELERDGQKHIQLANGRMGRRDNPPALKRLNKKWGWDAVANAVRAKFGPRFFRVPAPELDKEGLKAAKLAVEELKQLGLKIESDETFYAEPATLPDATEVQGGTNAR